MKQVRIALTILAILLAAQLGFGQNKTSKPEEKAAFVNGTRFLEQDPFNKKAKDVSKSLLFWLIEAPDVSVTLCSDFLLMDKKYKYAPEVTGQFTFGMAAFIIEHPDVAAIEKEVYAGGLDSVSRMYESMLKAKPETKNDFLEGLVEKRNKGELGNFVDDILAKGGCKKK
jgi:hypothetical protein